MGPVSVFYWSTFIQLSNPLDTTCIIVIAVNVWQSCDAYDILYICHSRRSVEAGVTLNCIWRTTVEEWTDHSRYVSGTKLRAALPVCVPFVGDVLCWICRTSSSANVPLTCERWGDSARRLSCVYGGPWKRAFRVNTRVVHFAVSHWPVRSVPVVSVRVFYTAIVSAAVVIYRSCFVPRYSIPKMTSCGCVDRVCFLYVVYH